jgi:hypothetical protein
MALIPAPARQFKTWSLILVIITGAGDLAIVMVNTLSADHVIGATTLAVSNAALMFAVGLSRFVAQQIPFTTEQKVDALTVMAQQPMKPGEAPVDVHVDGVKVESRAKGEGHA